MVSLKVIKSPCSSLHLLQVVSPSKRRFKIESVNKKQKILDISTEPDEGLIILTTKRDLDLQEKLLISYRVLRGDQVEGIIEDLKGNDMTSISNFELVPSGNDSIAPKVASAILDKNKLSIEFDSILRNTSISNKRLK